MSWKQRAAGHAQPVTGRQRPNPPAATPGRRLAWILPIVVLAAVAAGVWYFVFRESKEERATRLVQEGRTAMDLQDFVTAETKLQKALQLTPENGVLLHNLGVVYLKLDRKEDARAAFERAAAAHGPEASDVRAEELFQLATISYGEKQWQRAATELERAIAAHPTRIQLHTRLLDLQLGPLENPTAAESTTARFLRLCGRTPENLSNAGFLHYQNKNWAEAERLARQSIALQESYVPGHAILARSLWKSGKPRDGLRALEEPIARWPDAPVLWVTRSLLLADVGAHAEALEAADRAVALAPGDFEAHQTRQRALALLGRYEEALREIDVARQLTQDPSELRMLQTQQAIVRRMMGFAAGDSAAGSESSRTEP